jgi:hypothetical protein
MLKGECHLQLKDRVGARTAFKSAEKEAKDVKDMAAARAQALIVERSNSGRFTPAIGQGGEPIPIILIDDRKRAMTMLQDELWAKYKPDVDAALRAEQLAPIEKIFSSIADIYSLELFVTGDSAKAGDVMRQLGAHTYELMTNDVAKKASRVDYLMQVANSAVDFGHGWASTRTGLTSPQRNEVKEMIPYLTQVQKRASEYRGIASRLGGDEAKWNGLVADTTDALNDAESLADDR